jgi:hypothetical protein
MAALELPLELNFPLEKLNRVFADGRTNDVRKHNCRAYMCKLSARAAKTKPPTANYALCVYTCDAEPAALGTP